MRPPDFDELVDDAFDEDERERFRHVHDLLVAAGPPPELPTSLRRPPRVGRSIWNLPRRVALVAPALAALLVLGSFAAGYVLADRDEPVGFGQDFTFQMRGTEAVPRALASVIVGEREASGNWPMEMTVSGLPALPNRGRYELLLTRKGRIGPSCGTFLANDDATVYLNAPYDLRGYDGWVITRQGSTEILLRTSKI